MKLKIVYRILLLAALPVVLVCSAGDTFRRTNVMTDLEAILDPVLQDIPQQRYLSFRSNNTNMEFFGRSACIVAPRIIEQDLHNDTLLIIDYQGFEGNTLDSFRNGYEVLKTAQDSNFRVSLLKKTAR